jgi:hypothetical protein
MKISLKNLTLLTLLSLVAVSSAQARIICNRTITNHSNASWDVKFDTVYGEVKLDGASCQPGHCVLAAKQQVSVHYYYDIGNMRRYPATSGQITIKDNNGQSRLVKYYDNSLNLEDACPKLESYESTTGIAINHPARGDLTIEQDNWQI